MYTNVSKSDITLDKWDEEDNNSLLRVLDMFKECEIIYYCMAGTYIPISTVQHYGTTKGPCRGTINTCGRYLILKENVHPLVECMVAPIDRTDETTSFIIGENIDYIDSDFFMERKWEKRNGYVVLTPACVNYIFSHFDDINSIDDINKILHTNFDTLGESYISHSILYEGVNLQAKNKSKFNDEPFDEWSFIPVKLENRIIDMNDINKEGE